MQMADIFAEAHRIDLVEFDRMVGELVRIRNERWRNATPESGQAVASSRVPEAPSDAGRERAESAPRRR